MYGKVLLLTFIVACLPMIGCDERRPAQIVCLGDSLTVCGGGGKYTDWLSKWLPRATIINKGIGGDTLAGGRARFQRDVLELHPDVVVIELGANDFWRQNRPIEALEADLEDMVSRAKTAGAQVIIASCFGDRNYEEEQKVEFDSARFTYAKAIADMETRIGKKYDCFYVPNIQEDIKPNGKAPYWDDHNHPSKAGNEFVARRILEKLKPALKQKSGSPL